MDPMTDEDQMDGLAKILEAQTKDKETQVITGDWTNNISVSDMFSKDQFQKYYDIIKDKSAQKFNIPIPKTNEIVKIILDSHRIDGNIDWMTYRHAKFWKWNEILRLKRFFKII